MAFSIHDVIHHSQSSRYPNVIKKWNDIAYVTPETMDDGTEVFRFLRPSVSGAVNAENLPIGEISAVSKDALNEYAKKNFGGELPEVIAAHGFSEAGMQLDSPNQILDPRYSSVRANGINQNHGWKIHADFVSDLTKDEAYARAGRASDLSIIDQNTADIFDKRLANLGVDSNKFLNFYGKNHLKATGASFIDPNDIISASEVFQESGLTYKIAPDKYGSGRHLSAYPQSLEARDEITTKLEKKLGNRLVDQNDPNYRFNLPSDRDTGVKNTPISRGVSARFTTDYLGQDVATGKFDLASQFDESTLNDKGIVAPDKKFIVTGEINPEQIQRINSLTAESPEMARLLHGEDGYVSPYKTIEQIAQERSSGKIPISDSPKAIGIGKDAVPIDDYNYKGPLPPINGRGQIPVPRTPPPTSGPATSTTPPIASVTSNLPQSAVATETYDHGAKVSKSTASGETLSESPPPKSTRRGPIDIGKPVDDIRTRPTPKGSDAASARVTDSGAGRPVVDIPTAPPKPKVQPTTGATTPDPQAVSAKIASNPSQPAVTVADQTSDAKRMQRITKKLADDGMQTARNLASGNARAMGIAGAAALLGIGAYSIRDKSQEDMQRKLNRQRYGEM